MKQHEFHNIGVRSRIDGVDDEKEIRLKLGFKLFRIHRGDDASPSLKSTETARGTIVRQRGTIAFQTLEHLYSSFK